MSAAHDFRKERRVSGAHENDERTKGLLVCSRTSTTSQNVHQSALIQLPYDLIEQQGQGIFLTHADNSFGDREQHPDQRLLKQFFDSLQIRDPG